MARAGAATAGNEGAATARRRRGVALVLLGAVALVALMAVRDARAAGARLEAQCAAHGRHWVHAGEWLPPGDLADEAAVDCSGGDGVVVSFPNGARPAPMLWPALWVQPDAA